MNDVNSREFLANSNKTNVQLYHTEDGPDFEEYVSAALQIGL